MDLKMKTNLLYIDVSVIRYSKHYVESDFNLLLAMGNNLNPYFNVLFI